MRSSAPTLLVVGAAPVPEVLQAHLRAGGYRLEAAPDLPQAAEALARQHYASVLIDPAVLPRADAAALRRELDEALQRFDELVNVVVPIGVGLTAEKEFDRLLEMILLQARSYARADGGTLYLRRDDHLQFAILYNDSLEMAFGGTTGRAVPFAPLALYRDGAPNHSNIATHAALTRRSVNIPDAYAAAGFDFSGTRAFDRTTGYRSRSFLTIPLQNGRGEVLGVLQLLNARDEQGRITAFTQVLQRMIEVMAALAAVALEAYLREQQLHRRIQQLSIQIDEIKKERQVAEITETEYFKQLQERARSLRARANSRASGRPGPPGADP